LNIEKAFYQVGGGRDVLVRVVIYAFLIVVCVITLIPFVWVGLLSIRDTYSPAVILRQPFPRDPTPINYIKGFTEGNFLVFLANSVFITVVATVFCLLFDTLAGYAFAKLRIPGKEILFILFLGSLMLPFQVLMIPLFVTMKFLGLANTRIAIAIPRWAYVFGVFLMRESIAPIPRALTDAAKIDGCGEWRIFFQIIVPMVKPALVTLGIFTFIMTWNSFVWPLVITSDMAKMPISVGITTYFGKEIAPWGTIAALSVTGILPPVVLFLALQRYYIKGLMLSGIK